MMLTTPNLTILPHDAHLSVAELRDMIGQEVKHFAVMFSISLVAYVGA